MSADKYVVLLQHYFDGSNPHSARNDWVSFENYLAFQERQGSINAYDGFKNMFALVLTDIAWNWFGAADLFKGNIQGNLKATRALL